MGDDLGNHSVIDGRDNGSIHNGGCIGGSHKWSESGYILHLNHVKFADNSLMRCRKRDLD